MISEAAISFNDIDFYYGNFQALKRVSFKVPKGCVMGLIGPNGSGKSTILNNLTTRLLPRSGSISVMGLQADANSIGIRKIIGYAPEEPHLFKGLTPIEFLNICGLLHEMDEELVKTRTHELLSLFDLTNKSHHQIGSFSKGMKRKVLLASAMLHDPEILVLDEPMEGLDVFAQGALKSRLLTFRNQGKTIIYSTHTLEIVDLLCDHVCLIEAGNIIDFGPIQEVKERLKVEHFLDAFKKVEST